MAVSDLKAVADRLRELHDRLDKKTEHEWTQPEIAREAKVAYRTFQAWEEGHNENRDGTGYHKLARFYRRKLDDPTITYNWIVWGQQEPPEEPVANSGGATAASETQLSTEDSERIERIEKDIAEILKRLPAEPAREREIREGDGGLDDAEREAEQTSQDDRQSAQDADRSANQDQARRRESGAG